MSDKTLESVDLKIHDGPTEEDEDSQDERDELSSYLVIRINCKQGALPFLDPFPSRPRVSSSFTTSNPRISNLQITGLTRTHNLHISTPTLILGPRLPNDSIEVSKLRISADALIDVLEHFSTSTFSGGKKSAGGGGGKGGGSGGGRDLQLVWGFKDSRVCVKSEDVGKGSVNSFIFVCETEVRCRK